MHFFKNNCSVVGVIAVAAFLLTFSAPIKGDEVTSPPPSAEKVNLMENPGAETQIAAAQVPFDVWYRLSNDFLELADTLPEGWGVGYSYTKNDCGHVKILWGSTDKEAHSGERSCFLKVLDRRNQPDTDEMNVRIMLGKSGGADNKNAMVVEAGKEYYYSFWIKGDVGAINVSASYWDAEGKSVWGPLISHGSEMVGADWKQISGIFKPVDKAKWMVVSIGVVKAKTGQAIYVDDAVLGLNTPVIRELAEASAKDAKSKTSGAQALDKQSPTLRVLFIGNSQMLECQLPMMMKLMSKSAPADCPRIECGQMLQGGWGLKNHWDAGDGPKTARSSIAAGNWDYVVIQARGDVALPELETYVPMYDEMIRKVGAKTILFSTSRDPKYYSDGIRKSNDMHIEFGKKHDIVVAPGGLPWISFLGANPTEEQLLDLYAPDKSHPGGKGTYIYACLLYSVITGKSPVGLVSDIAPIPADYVYGKRIYIGQEEAARMQKAAWEQYQEGVKK